jgi:hypothetical protein
MHQRNFKFLYIVLLTLFFFGTNERNSAAQSREDLVKAGYIEKFTHFIQWPAASIYNNENLIIGIIGENSISKALSDIFSKSFSKDKRFSIIPISSVDQIRNCMILFISGSEKSNLEKILNYTTGKPILTISDSKGFGNKGVIINMFQDGNYIRYEINRKSLDISGLIINSMLLNYAVII